MPETHATPLRRGLSQRQRLGMVDKVRAAHPIPVIDVVPGQSALSSA